MPDNWTALKCEECGNPLKPLVTEGIEFIYLESARDAQEVIEKIKESYADHPKPFSPIPIFGGDMQVEVVKSPLADLLRCTSCGLLYERESNGNKTA